MSRSLLEKIEGIFDKTDSGRGITDGSVRSTERSEQLKENRFNLNNRLPFSKRMSDPAQNYFVYGMQQSKFVPKTPDGVKITELEDPTYYSFDLEIVTNESPLYKQVWCYTDKYQLHPEFRSRHEYYILFLKVLSYYIKADDTPSSNSSTMGADDQGADVNTEEGSSSRTNTVSAVRQFFNNPLRSRASAAQLKNSPTRGQFSGDKLVHTNSLMQADAQDLYTPESTVPVKKHYITKVSGLDKLHEVPAHGMRYSSDYVDKTITIHFREDVVEWTKLLTKLYNDMCYSVKNQRRVIPNNLLEFTLRIKVSEVREIPRVQTALQEFNNAIRFDFRELLLNPVLQRAGRHWGRIEQVYDKELSAVRALVSNLSFYRYTLYGCQFTYPMKYSNDSIDIGRAPSSFKGTSVELTYKRAYEEFVSDVVPDFTTRGPAILHLDNNNETMIRTGGLEQGTSAGSNEVSRAYSRNRTTGSQLSTGQNSTFETIFNNSPLLTRGKEIMAQSLVAFKDQAVANVASDIRDQLGVEPLLPQNIYRPGDLLQQVVQQAASRGFNDLTEILTGR